MSITLETSPSDRAGFRYNTAHNPYIFNFVRRDRAFNGIQRDGINTYIFVWGGTPPVAEGDVIYIKDLLTDVITGTANVISIHAPYTVDPANAKWAVLTDFESPALPLNTSGYVIWLGTRISYRLQINFYDWETGDLFATGNYFPNTDGVLTADVKEYLLPQISFSESFDYRNGINRLVPSQDKAFKLGWKEVWIPKYAGQDNPPESEFINEERYVAVKSAKQRRDELGSNMTTNSFGPAANGNFMTEFEQPCVWDGLPFAISFIYDIDNNYAVREISQFNINMVDQSLDQSDNLNASEQGHVNGLSPIKGVTLDPLTKFVKMEISEGGALPGGYTGTDPAGTGCGSSGSGSGGSSSDWAEEGYIETS